MTVLRLSGLKSGHKLSALLARDVQLSMLGQVRNEQGRGLSRISNRFDVSYTISRLRRSGREKNLVAERLGGVALEVSTIRVNGWLKEAAYSSDALHPTGDADGTDPQAALDKYYQL